MKYLILLLPLFLFSCEQEVEQYALNDCCYQIGDDLGDGLTITGVNPDCTYIVASTEDCNTPCAEQGCDPANFPVEPGTYCWYGNPLIQVEADYYCSFCTYIITYNNQSYVGLNPANLLPCPEPITSPTKRIVDGVKEFEEMIKSYLLKK